MKLAVGYGRKSRLLSHPKGVLIVPTARTREVLDRMSDNPFDLGFRIHNFVSQGGLVEIGKIRMRHRMTPNLESLRIEFPHLCRFEIAGSAQELRSKKESRVEPRFAQHRSSSNQIGFASIVECDADAGTLGMTIGILDGFANTYTPPSRLFEPFHLLPETLDGQNVAHVSSLGLAEVAPGQLQFVIHQKNDARGGHGVER